jgi:hypothetical protein
MEEEILNELRAELEETEGEKLNVALLKSKVKGAYRAVKTARKYPLSYTEAMIDRDMENYYSQVREIALFDYNQIGSEGQTQYSQDGVSIHYVDRNALFYGVLPIAVRG